MREELDAKLTNYMNELQDSALTMVGWLEDRMMTRVDDLVDKSRKSIWNEMKALDKASDKLAASTPAEPMLAVEHPGQPLSLTMYIDRARRPDPKPAA